MLFFCAQYCEFRSENLTSYLHIILLCRQTEKEPIFFFKRVTVVFCLCFSRFFYRSYISRTKQQGLFFISGLVDDQHREQKRILIMVLHTAVVLREAWPIHRLGSTLAGWYINTAPIDVCGAERQDLCNSR